MGQVPVVNVYHSIATVNFHHRRDQGDNIVADVPDVGTVVNGQPVSQFHQGGWRTGFRRVDRAGYVIDGKGRRHKLVSFSVVHIDSAWVGKSAQPLTVLI